MRTSLYLTIVISLFLCGSCSRTQCQPTASPDADNDHHSDQAQRSPERPQESQTGQPASDPETIVCTLEYERNGTTTEEVLRINAENQSVSHQFHDLRFSGSYTPPGPEGNVFTTRTNLEGQTGNIPLAGLFQFPGEAITSANIGGFGFTGQVRVIHPESRSSLQYFCIRDGVESGEELVAIGPSAPVSTVHCVNTYRRSEEVSIEQRLNIELNRSRPDHASPFRSLTLRSNLDLTGAQPMLVIAGTQRGATEPVLEVSHRFDGPIPQHIFAGFHGFTGLFFAHQDREEMQFYCSTVPLVH